MKSLPTTVAIHRGWCKSVHENKVYITFIDVEKKRKLLETIVCKWKMYIHFVNNLQLKTVARWRKFVIQKKSSHLNKLLAPKQISYKVETKSNQPTANVWKAMQNTLSAKKYARKWYFKIAQTKQDKPIKQHVKVVHLMFEFDYLHFFVNNAKHCFQHIIDITKSHVFETHALKYMFFITRLIDVDQTFDEYVNGANLILKSSFPNFLRHVLTLTNNLRKKKSILNFVMFFHETLKSFIDCLKTVANFTLPSLIHTTIQKMHHLYLFSDIPVSMHRKWQQEKLHLRMFSDLPQDDVNITKLWLVKSSERNTGLLKTFSMFCDLYDYDE